MIGTPGLVRSCLAKRSESGYEFLKNRYNVSSANLRFSNRTTLWSHCTQIINGHRCVAKSGLVTSG